MRDSEALFRYGHVNKWHQRITILTDEQNLHTKRHLYFFGSKQGPSHYGALLPSLATGRFTIGLPVSDQQRWTTHAFHRRIH